MANKSGIKIEDLEDAIAEIGRLQHNLQQSRQDNKALADINENAEYLRRASETEKALQHFYSDLVLDNAANMLFIFDEWQRLVVCGSACVPLLKNADRAAVKGKLLGEVFKEGISEIFVQRLKEQNAKVCELHTPYAHDDTLHMPSGEVMYLQVAITPIEDAAGNCRGTVLSLNNVTELVKIRHKAEEATRSKSSFLANMSAEIRMPMNAIKGLSELLSLTNLDTLQRNYVNNILASSGTLINIINDILDFSEIDAGKLELNYEEYDLNALIAEISSVGGMRNANKDIKLMVGINPSMPSLLWGDDVRIKQVIVNLINNAVKYTYEGHVWLKMDTEPFGDKVKLVCSVEDTGIGIKPEALEGLFDAFTRVDLKTNRNISGAGLGLTIAKYLVHAMGGEIWVKSEYGKGSTFGFWVPQRVVNPAPLAALKHAGEVHVLLVGDELRMNNIQSMLNGLNAQNDIYCTGGEPPCTKDGYTHIMYDDTVPAKVIRRLRRQNPKSMFAVLRSMQGALIVSEVEDTVLFVPIIITDLVKFLDRSNKEEAAKEKIVPPAEIPEENELQVIDTKILVVDDNEINIMVASEMLLAFGADVDSAYSGQEALQKCADTKYDIIFLDHMMPGMDGIEVTSHLRRSEGPNRQTPIVALTANVAENIESYYVRCGMDDYTAKPVAFADLMRVLESWLPQQKLVSRSKNAASSYAFTPWTGKKSAPAKPDVTDELIAYMNDIGDGLATNDYSKVHAAMKTLGSDLQNEKAKKHLDLMLKAIDLGNLADATYHYADAMAALNPGST